MKSETRIGNMREQIELIAAEEGKNGLTAFQTHTGIYSVRAVSLSGRKGRLVWRYNPRSGHLLVDGTTFRAYCNYAHATDEQIRSLCQTKIIN